MVQCSGVTPCARCTAEACKCIFDPYSDRRRRDHLALSYTVAKLRRGTPDDIKSLILALRSTQTDQDAITFLAERSGRYSENPGDAKSA